MRKLVLCFILCLPLLAALGPAFAFEYAECNGNPCQWDTFPVQYYIHEPLGVDLAEDDAVSALRQSVERWNHDRQTFCEPLAFGYQGRIESDAANSQDNHNIVSFETDFWLFGPEALAVTVLWFDASGTLQEADIAFNAINWHWTLGAANPSEGLYSVRPTLTHEAGHFWGLGHSHLKEATMYAFYKPTNYAQDLDEDDIQAAAHAFCGEALPADDGSEQNDSFFGPAQVDGQTTLADRRLYDDDWYKLTLQKGLRLKVTVFDESSVRFKYLELYDVKENLIGRERCDGDCAQALGEAGEERLVTLRVYGDFDNHAVETALYSLVLEQVAPGEEGELTDDDGPAGGDDDDDGNRCGCAVSAADTGANLFGALIMIGGIGLLGLLRRKR